MWNNELSTTQFHWQTVAQVCFNTCHPEEQSDEGPWCITHELTRRIRP